MSNPIWVVVNHKEKTIQHFRGGGINTQEGCVYMSMEYFTNHYSQMMDIGDYRII